MRVITHCPSCQTQFFATEEQLNKHGGKVRCGHCMQVFDAKAQLVTITESNSESGISFTENTTAIPPVSTAEPIAQAQSSTVSTIKSDMGVSTTDMLHQQPAYLDDASKKTIASRKNSRLRNWLWASGALLLVLVAALQSIYFLRDTIAIYYPNLKPYLVQACQQLSCSINLPKHIESIIIDDSDMQEDADHAGLVRFSSTLINNGSHVLAYPNLELTLTDVDDKPILRRIFKPAEYLPADTKIADGFQAGEQTKINLAITTADVSVTGYRVFVTY